MFDDITYPNRVLANPGILQNAVLVEIQNRLSGKYLIADPNNGFNLLLEVGSSLTAQFVRQEDQQFDAMYAVRAQTPEQLYPFLSDFDYVNLTASPSSMMVRLLLGHDWVVSNAVEYNNDYNIIVIPASTTFQLGSMYFGLYYPINILVGKITQSITVLYDLSVPNPLQSLSSNNLYDVNQFTQGGVDFLSLIFPVYQFNRTIYNETISTNIGWIKTYALTNQFYAARVFTNLNNIQTELSYTLSQTVYDPSTPTVIITVNNVNNTLSLEIPQIYFTNNQIGSSLTVQIYTTLGEVNTTISIVDANQMMVNFDPTSSPNSAMLAQPPILSLTPYNQTTIVGGSNAMDFATLRTQVINGTLYSTIPITPSQLTSAANKYGFNLTKFVDNITNRIYYASAPLITPTGNIVPIAIAGILLNSTYLSGDPSTILSFSDGTYTILPTTLFSFNTTTNVATPLSDNDVYYLSTLTNSDLATMMNSNTYTRQPYHILLDTNSLFPTARSFNLMNPVMTNLTFVGENVNLATQMSVTNISIVHLNNGTGGYQITLGVKRSVALTSSIIPYTKLVLLTTTESNVSLSFEATYQSTNSSGVDIYTALVPVNYNLSTTDYFQTTFPLITGGSSTISSLPLTTTFTIYNIIEQSQVPSILPNGSITTGLPSLYDSYIVMSQQLTTIQFGSDLSNDIFNSVNTTWGSNIYQTHPVSLYYQNQSDVYMKSLADPLVPVYRSVTYNGAPFVDMVVIYPQGSNVLTGTTYTFTTYKDLPAGTIIIQTLDTFDFPQGTPIVGPGLAAGTTVTGTNGVLTLSKPMVQNVTTGVQFFITNTMATTTVFQSQTAAGNTVIVSSITDIQVGYTVFGFDIVSANTSYPPAQGSPTTVIGISGTTLTLSQNTIAPLQQGAQLMFFNPNGPAETKYTAGSIALDSNNNPIVLQNRSNVFNINALQLDARLYASQNALDIAYISSVPQLIQTTAQSLDTLRNNLLERTYLYYTPTQTYGTAQFDTGNGNITTLDLGISLDINVYVSESTINDTNLTTLMRQTIITQVMSYLSSNTLISSNAIGNIINTALGPSVQAIDVSGIDNNDTYRTVSIYTTGALMSVAYSLTVQSDGTLAMTPNITVNFIVTPTTGSSVL